MDGVVSAAGTLKMSRRKEIFKDAGIYTLGSYAAQALDVVNSILLRRFLGPSSMGMWAFLQVVLSYAKHASLGITAATGRDVPYYLGKGEATKVEEVKNLVFTFTFFTALLTGVGVLLFAWIKRREYPTPLVVGLCVTGFLIVLQRLYNLFVVLLRAHKEFTFASVLNFLSSLFTIFFTLLLTWRFQLYGFLVGTVLGYVALLILILIKTKYRFSFYFSYKPFVSLLSLGLAVLISDVLRAFLMSIDRILITKYLGFEALGFYSVALMASNYLYALPNMLGIIFFPHFQEVYAKQDKAKDLECYLRQPTLCLAYLFPCFIGLVWILSSWLVPWMLPEYASGVPALRYLSLGSFFLALTHPFSLFIITVRKHWHLVPLQVAVIALGFSLTRIFIQRGWGIDGVALGGVVIAGFYFVALSAVCLKEVYSWRQSLQLYGIVFLTFFYFGAWLLGLERLFRAFPEGGLKFLFEMLLYGLGMIPLVWRAQKEGRVLTTFASLIQERFSKEGTKKKTGGTILVKEVPESDFDSELA